jgi:hypothetical protein
MTQLLVAEVPLWSFHDDGKYASKKEAQKAGIVTAWPYRTLTHTPCAVTEGITLSWQ